MILDILKSLHHAGSTHIFCLVMQFVQYVMPSDNQCILATSHVLDVIYTVCDAK